MKSKQKQTTPCPVCNKLFPLQTINRHVDLCLNSAAEERRSESEPKRQEGDKDANAQLRPSTAQSQCAQTDRGDGRTRLTVEGRSSPAGGGGGEDGARQKQSVLVIGKRGGLEAAAGARSAPGGPPPAKSRKLDFTPKRSSQLMRPEHSSLAHKSLSLASPLADMVRPASIEGYVGQEKAVGENSILRTVMMSGQVPSLIFWGPPGCGKTTLARIMARVAHDSQGTRFVQLSATTSGVNDVKEVVKIARNERAMFKRKTILFIDEIHRFNKLQQDTFLPHVEDGTITLLGATTENPSFQLNSALLSRCRVIVLDKLQPLEVMKLLRRALPKVGAVERKDTDLRVLGEVVKEKEELQSEVPLVLVEESALSILAELCDGDARSALNGLQLAVEAKRSSESRAKQKQCLEPSSIASTSDVKSSQGKVPPSTKSSVKCSEVGGVHTEHSSELNKDVLVANPATPSSSASTISTVTTEDAKESLQRTHLVYDRAGDEHYNIISALHKSMRGSDANASLYWLARMLCAGEDPLYVARRVIRFASEDIGLADPSALPQAVSAYQACQFIGMPECEVILAQAVVHMARAPKSVEVYAGYGAAKSCIKNHQGPQPSVPLHLRNAPTQLMRSLGHGRGYKYNPAFSEPVEQQYLPNGLRQTNFLTPQTS